METELKEKKRRIGELEMALRPFLPSLVQVNVEGRENTTVGQMTSIKLSVPSLATQLLPSPLVDQLSCQLTEAPWPTQGMPRLWPTGMSVTSASL